LKIAIDIREVRSYRTGIGRHFAGLIRGLISIGSRHTFTLITNPANPLSGSGYPANWKIFPVRSRPKTMGQHLTLHRELSGVDHDILLTNPFGYSMLGKGPYALIILDMINRRYPDLVSFKARLFERFLARRAAAGARLILTISSFSRDDIRRYLGEDLKNIAVTHLAAEPVFSATGSFPGRDQSIDGLGITKSFFLYVGNRRPHKNLKSLLEIYAVLKKEWSAERALPLLVIVGDADRPVTSRLDYDLRALAENMGIRDQVIVTGRLADEELACLYRGALFLTHPALVEGFGLTPLEAMQSGCPVIASKTSSIPEIVGEAGVLLDPGDTRSWVETIVKLTLDDRAREGLRERGLIRAKQFSWEKTARETLSAIEGVI